MAPDEIERFYTSSEVPTEEWIKKSPSLF